MQIVAPARCSSRSRSITASPLLRIEVAGRLVGEQDQRLAGDGAGDRDALLLTARELAGQVLRAVRHADALERRFDALLALGRPSCRDR